MKPQKFYVVWKGRTPGIYRDWDSCSAQVNGYAGARYKAYPSLATAQAAFSSPVSESRPAAAQARLLSLNPPILPSIAVDAACSGAPGPVEWRAVDTQTAKEFFKRGPFPGGTNNVGEFLAIAHAQKWLKDEGLSLPIYSDSKIAIGWVKAGICKTELVRTPRNAPLFDLIAEAEAWLAAHGLPAPVLKWDTDAWGENPADFGRK